MRRDFSVLLCFLSGCNCGFTGPVTSSSSCAPASNTPTYSTGCAPLQPSGAPDGSIASDVNPDASVTISGTVALLPGTAAGAVQVYRGGVDEYGSTCTFPGFPGSPFLEATVESNGSYSFELYGADAVVQIIPDAGVSLDGGIADASTEDLDAGDAPDLDDGGLVDAGADDFDLDAGDASAPDDSGFGDAGADSAPGPDAGDDLESGDGGIDLGVPPPPTEVARCFRVFYGPSDAGPTTWIDFPVVQQEQQLDPLTFWDVTPTDMDEGGALEIDWPPSPQTVTVVVSDASGTLWEEVQPPDAGRWLLPKYLAGSDSTDVQLITDEPAELTPDGELGTGSSTIAIGAPGQPSLLSASECVWNGAPDSPCPFNSDGGGSGMIFGPVTFSLLQPGPPGHLVLTGVVADDLTISTSADGVSFTPAASEEQPPEFLDVDLTTLPAAAAIQVSSDGSWELLTARLTPP